MHNLSYIRFFVTPSTARGDPALKIKEKINLNFNINNLDTPIEGGFKFKAETITEDRVKEGELSFLTYTL